MAAGTAARTGGLIPICFQWHGNPLGPRLTKDKPNANGYLSLNSAHQTNFP
jgi:hypothetical protein